MSAQVQGTGQTNAVPEIRTNVRSKPNWRQTVVVGALRATSSVAPRLAARWAARLFFTPLRSTPSPRMRRQLATGTSFFLQHETGRIAGWRWGKGPVVYLIHGWSGRGGQLAAFVKPLVAQGFSVVAFDAPGHGESEGGRTTLLEFERALRAVAEKQGQPHAMIAHSLGGAACALALQMGLRAERIVFIGTPSDPARYFRSFLSRFGVSDSARVEIERSFESRFQFRWDDLSLVRIGAKVNAPLLVVHDRDDEEVPCEEGNLIVSAWPKSQLLSTEGLGHRRILHDPEVVDHVVDFISQTNSRTERKLSMRNQGETEPEPTKQSASGALRSRQTCASPDCTNLVIEEWDEQGRFCARCTIEGDLFDRDARRERLFPESTTNF